MVINKRFAILDGVLLCGFSISALGATLPVPFDPTDPTGFCEVPASATACSNPTGLAGETIGISGGSFGMFKTGGGTSDATWFLLVSVPEMVAGTATAPTITSASFTQSGSTVDVGALAHSPSSTDIYTMAGLKGPNSMNAANMFCDGASIPCVTSNEISAFGSLPNFFEVFEYAFTPAFNGKTAYAFTVGGGGLINGTYLAASGDQGDTTNGLHGFSTPFTTTGLVNGPGCPDCGQGFVPEPSQIGFLVGAVGLLGLMHWRKRKQQQA